MKFIRSTWPYFALGVWTGIIIIWFGAKIDDKPLTREVVVHIGTAVLVATIVTIFFHIQEVKNHLNHYARIVLVESEYLNFLKPETLVALREKIAPIAIREVVKNEQYEYPKIAKQLEQMLFSSLMHKDGPRKSGYGEYRRSYVETIDVNFMTAQVLAEACGVGAEKMRLAVADQGIYARVTTTCHYDLVFPVAHKTQYPIPLSGELLTVSFLEKERQVSFEVGTGKVRTKVPLAIDYSKNMPEEADNAPKNRIDYKGVTEVDVPATGTVRVFTKIVEIQSAEQAPYMLSQMQTLTDSPAITISSNVNIGLLRVYTMGLGKHEREGEPDGRAARLTYTGWMAEDHAYMVCWAPAEIRAALRV